MTIRTRQEFVVELDQTMDEVRRALTDRRAGKTGVGDPEQLEPILETLKSIAGQVGSSKIPPKDKRDGVVGGIIYMVIDSWDLNDPLSHRLADLWNYYLHKL